MQLIDLSQIKNGKLIQTNVETLKNKKVKFPLKLTGTIQYVSGTGYVVNFDKTIDSYGYQYDNTLSYEVYYPNNKPILNEQGKILKYDFVSNNIIGTPSIMDTNSIDIFDANTLTVPYTPIDIADNISFKMFPTVLCNSIDLPDNYLSSLIEHNSCYYYDDIDQMRVVTSYLLGQANFAHLVTDGIRAFDGQTSFNLSKIPDDNPVVLIINSIEYIENDDFTVDRNKKILTWTFTLAAGGFDILSSDRILIKYRS